MKVDTKVFWLATTLREFVSPIGFKLNEAPPDVEKEPKLVLVPLNVNEFV